MNSTSKTLLASLLLVSAQACGGGGGDTTPEPAASYEGPVASSDTAGGQQLFQTHCGSCHTGQSGSYGPRVADLAWTPAHMREQIREGSGRMPGFDAAHLSADQLEATLAFLQTLNAVVPNPAPEAGPATTATP